MATVLVIDGDRTFLERVGEALQRAGFRVLSASHSDHAMRLCRDYPPDVALLHDVLPDCTGIALACHLRELRPKLPVVLLTGDAAISDGLAIADYVVPYLAGVEEIISKLTQAVAKTKTAAQGS